ncbi:MAG TPA: nuclear transport factor 2 family protein [Streptosporangiaceae bacterium]|nr:nuclear transport factor 2 family protein [Streptosporangiaceae bacterium]
MLTELEAEEFRIRTLIEKWALSRDAGDWASFATVWHDDGWMTATWFQGPAADFIRASQAGFEAGVNILHFLGGSVCTLSLNTGAGGRAIAQTKMTIQQRAEVHGVTADVTCTGRFYDFLARRDGRWGIVRRQPVYEKDRLDPVDPAAQLSLDAELLGSFPAGYRHLAYLQHQLGFQIAPGLPGLRGPAVELLYREGRDWLDGSPRPGVPTASTLRSPGSAV